MKILMLSEYFPSGKDLKFSGGVEARNLFVAKHLSKRHKVTIISSNIYGQKEKEKVFGINVIRVGSKRSYNATTGNIFDRIIFIKDAINVGKSLDIDIVEGTNFITHFIAKRISKSKNIPEVAWYPDVWIGNWIKNVGIYGVLGEILERFNLRQKSDAYIAISKQTSEKLAKFVHKKIYVINCGIEKEKNSNNINNINPTIICVSRLTKYKNIKTLIFAFADLSLKLNNALLKIIGSGPELNNLKKTCEELSIKKKVHFFSNLSRIKLMDYYQSSHIFCLPSTVEGFGIATIEAASLGIPYVNANTPIQREITKNALGGYLAEPYSPKDFSHKFYKLFSDKKLYSKKSQEAKNLSKYYDWGKIAAQTEKVYKSLI